jgi:hypothetical protein
MSSIWYYGYTMKPWLDGSPFGWKLRTELYGFATLRTPASTAARTPKSSSACLGASAAFGWLIDGNADTIAGRLGFVVSINSARNLLVPRKVFWGALQGTLLTGDLAAIFNVPAPAGFLVKTVAQVRWRETWA